MHRFTGQWAPTQYGSWFNFPQLGRTTGIVELPITDLDALRDAVLDARMMSRGYGFQQIGVEEVEVNDLIYFNGRYHPVTDVLSDAHRWHIESSVDEVGFSLPEGMQVRVYRLIE